MCPHGIASWLIKADLKNFDTNLAARTSTWTAQLRTHTLEHSPNNSVSDCILCLYRTWVYPTASVCQLCHPRTQHLNVQCIFFCALRLSHQLLIWCSLCPTDPWTDNACRDHHCWKTMWSFPQVQYVVSHHYKTWCRRCPWRARREWTLEWIQL